MLCNMGKSKYCGGDLTTLGEDAIGDVLAGELVDDWEVVVCSFVGIETGAEVGGDIFMFVGGDIFMGVGDDIFMGVGGDIFVGVGGGSNRGSHKNSVVFARFRALIAVELASCFTNFEFDAHNGFSQFALPHPTVSCLKYLGKLLASTPLSGVVSIGSG
jgi:hypothetical protein